MMYCCCNCMPACCGEAACTVTPRWTCNTRVALLWWTLCLRPTHTSQLSLYVCVGLQPVSEQTMRPSESRMCLVASSGPSCYLHRTQLCWIFRTCVLLVCWFLSFLFLFFFSCDYLLQLLLPASYMYTESCVLCVRFHFISALGYAHMYTVFLKTQIFLCVCTFFHH